MPATRDHTKRSLIQLAMASALASALPTPALADDPAAEQISAFYAALLNCMRSGRRFPGRAELLEPAISRAFDAPTMTRFAVGESWSLLQPAIQTQLIASFKRLIVSNYAHNFDSYAGERFVVDPTVQTRGPDRIVQSRLVPTHGDPIALAYRLRETSAGWQIIDVYYQSSISELTTRRAEFASILRSGGAPALVTHLNELAQRLAN